jgi:hypothetical protein
MISNSYFVFKSGLASVLSFFATNETDQDQTVYLSKCI